MVQGSPLYKFDFRNPTEAKIDVKQNGLAALDYWYDSI